MKNKIQEPKTICVSKAVTESSENGRTEHYAIFNEAGDLGDLTFANIVFIRDKLSDFIAKRGKRFEEEQ